MLVRGEWQVHHRFRTCPLQPGAFSGPAVGLRKEGRSFTLGWMLAINGADGSHTTLCTGGLMGLGVLCGLGTRYCVMGAARPWSTTGACMCG